MIHDSIAPSAIEIAQNDLGLAQVEDPTRIAVVLDHVAPASNVQTATAQQGVRQWAREQGIVHFHDVGSGIAHQVLIEERLARPGLVLVGSDSHSTAYGAVAAFGTGMGATDIAIIMATGRTWLRVPETIRIVVRGSFDDEVRPKDLALHLARVLGAEGARYAAVEYAGPAIEALSPGDRTTLATMALEIGGEGRARSPRRAAP